MPAAESIGNRNLVAGETATVGLETAAGWTGNDGLDRDPGDFVGVLVGVASHAALGSLRDGPVAAARDVENVKDAAEIGID